MEGKAIPSRWSLVVGGRLEDPARAEAWRTLCDQFRPPVLAALRERFAGRRPTEDLASAFFAFLRSIRPDASDYRLRTHLARLLRVFLHDLHSGRSVTTTASLTPAGKEEERAALATACDAFAAAPPDDGFHALWTQCLLHAALRRLRGTHPDAHTLLLRFHDRPAGSSDPLPALATERKATPAEIVRRLGQARAALRDLFAEEVKHTLAAGASLDEEQSLLGGHTGGLLDPATWAPA
ncbi:MAG: hypothetical protein ACT4PV_12100 [Planctomycetaceae bacterium]